MAIIGFLAGSFFGLIGAVIGWAALDMTVLTAAGFYLGAGLSFGLLGAAAESMRGLHTSDLT